ncbi:hypothetical protein CKJ65_04025 [Mycobacterium intracellulare]|nr:hypothetical protein CKJ65_04025 [Mycobacterium intracellulare]
MDTLVGLVTASGVTGSAAPITNRPPAMSTAQAASAHPKVLKRRRAFRSADNATIRCVVSVRAFISSPVAVLAPLFASVLEKVSASGNIGRPTPYVLKALDIHRLLPSAVSLDHSSGLASSTLQHSQMIARAAASTSPIARLATQNWHIQRMMPTSSIAANRGPRVMPRAKNVGIGRNASSHLAVSLCTSSLRC